MAKNNNESITDVLQELEQNKFVKVLMERWHEISKMHMRTTAIVILAVLATILLLNWGGKLTMESNGWILAALIGYLFGRGTQNIWNK